MARRMESFLIALAALCILAAGGELVRSVAAAQSAAPASPVILEPEQAFQVQVHSLGGSRVAVDFTVAPDHYLYRDRLQFTVRAPQGVALQGADLPVAKTKNDPSFGIVQVYEQPFRAIVRLGDGHENTPVELNVAYQGCSANGVCYLPQEQLYRVDLATPGPATTIVSTDSHSKAGASAGAGAPDASSKLVMGSFTAATVAARPAPAGATTATSDVDQVAALFASKGMLLVIASFFGFGLLLAFTPCVFPMIPILSGIIAGEGTSLTRRGALGLSLAYVLGMAVTYAVAGVAAGLSGSMLTAALQNAWVLSAFALVFVALSLSMFGLYELQLPSAMQSRLNDWSNGLQGGKSVSVFVMGALSALIVGPCVAAPLAGALLYIGQSGDVLLGGAALFAMALGMGVPLLIVGASAGALLPRAGKWMEGVKRLFGVMLLAVAIWIVSPVVPPIVPMALWGVLLVIYAMYLRAIDPLPEQAGGVMRLAKGLGVVMLLAGAAMLIGALSGNPDPLQPLASVNAKDGGRARQATPRFERVTTVAQFDERLKAAAGRPVMVDFYADWCVSCKEMERFTFSDARVQARLNNAVLIKIDVTGNSADAKTLLRRFGLFGPPGIAFFDARGAEIKAAQVVGFRPADQFLATLDQVLRTN